MFAFVLFLCQPALASQSLRSGQGALRVMTYNVYEGTDYLEVEGATTPGEFLILGPWVRIPQGAPGLASK